MTCSTHIQVGPTDYIGRALWAEKLLRRGVQRQCPACLLWYFHCEFGPGWKKGRKP